MKKYSCHKISEGCAEAEAIVSKDHIMFYLMNPKKVLIFPGGKGSSVVQADGLYQLKMNQNMPAAMIVQYPETVLVSSAIIMEVPMVDKVDPAFYEDVKDGDRIRVDADNGIIEIL